MIRSSNIKGKAILVKYQKGIGCLFFSAMSATIKFEAVPIKVPFAPIFAPKASAHHNTVTDGPRWREIFSITGIAKAIMGILSKKEDVKVETPNIV